MKWRLRHLSFPFASCDSLAKYLDVIPLRVNCTYIAVVKVTGTCVHSNESLLPVGRDVCCSTRELVPLILTVLRPISVKGT